MDTTSISPRHIQDHGEANTTLELHWGYPSRVLPCMKDRGTCEYLDAVYWMHDVSMLYTFILWGVLLGIAVMVVWTRGWRMGGSRNGGLVGGVCEKLARWRQRWLLQDPPARWLFGRTSRLQVLILVILLAYLLIFSLVGITYRTWLTPIKSSTRHNTRTGLGGLSDRIGALAFALTPFTVLLSMRESLLSVMTGIPYTHFNFLHRWTGRIIFVQAALHTIGWTIVEGKLYQPQPSVYREFIRQMYMVFGCVAMFLLTLMVVLSTKTAIRWFGYEFFKVTHWVLAIFYLGACWGHWDKLWCWVVASLVLVVVDKVARVARTMLIHYREGKGRDLGFHCAQAHVRLLGTPNDLVVRLDFDYEHSPWLAGQHFHLTFPSLSIWQSHPFTPSSQPGPNAKIQHHTYLLRVRKGITARLASLGDNATVPVILCGPYGQAFPSYKAQNVLAVAGGTGVTFTLPVVLEAVKQQLRPRFAIEFVWIVRRAQDLRWLGSELAELKSRMSEAQNLRVRIFVTRESGEVAELAPDGTGKELESEDDGSLSDKSLRTLLTPSTHFSIGFLDGRHPSMPEIVHDFVERASSVGGTIEILSSGPEEMGSDLRSAVASVESRDDVGFYWDSRG
ncbi:hypothetical protein LTR78_009175 [Recurvomyces mirabilis]|uniref:ferric-chelate reductase (NADPH) n=1 Tax=Recurvomyces mirabilis TaxID=574656 RepID=A0AAE0WHH0_9PEZI|nr:hypothetical protein LTR78_009175 [Recurvomyces mirabilis]KAK5155665.1 hypothetical protein LTS14_005926 [Recurvomyces mirabilis]